MAPSLTGTSAFPAGAVLVARRFIGYSLRMVYIDDARVDVFAAFLREADEVRPFHFCGDGPGDSLPPAGAPGALDAFFFATAHQYGFWLESDARYNGPMIARIDGREMKGSDFLFRCVTRALESRAEFFAPAHLATLSDEDWNRVFADDAGRNPLPAWSTNRDIIRSYVAWFAGARVTPRELVSRVNAAERPLASFLSVVGCIPGYAEDPLRKKLMLLAVILENRPERFLRVTDSDAYEPIIDYHLQRSALRTGLVVIDDPNLRTAIVERRVIAAAAEESIRRATFEAVRRLVARSGRSVAAVDWFFFTNRRRCPEMTIPDCEACPVRGICRRDTALFQPIHRTTAY